MNHLFQPAFRTTGRRAIRAGGIVKNGFAFLNPFVYYPSSREQTGVQP
jgi:hypothetical protein